MDNTVPGEIDLREDLTPREFWAAQIELSEDEYKDYCEEAERVIWIYNDDEQNAESLRPYFKRLNIFWSNTQTLSSALFQGTALTKPDIRRRTDGRNPVARQSAVVLEKATSYCMDSYDPDEPLELGIWDALVPGMGVVRVVYDYEMDEVEPEPVRLINIGSEQIGPMMATPDGMPYIGEYEEDEEGAFYQEDPYEELSDQKVYFQYVHWKDFGHTPARCWDEVDAVWFIHYLTKREMIDRFGDDVANKAGYNSVTRAAEKRYKSDDEIPEIYKRAKVYEIWDKEKRQRVWWCQDYKEGLLKNPEDDPYKLENFFPLPEPLILNRRSSATMKPWPLYCVYRDQAEELNQITTKLYDLQAALKYRGLYAAGEDALSEWNTVGNNEFKPVENWAAYMEKGGLANLIHVQDISQIIQAEQDLREARELCKQGIYEVSGIGDIMRAQSDPRETATAQRMKGKFGSLRLQKMITAVQNWVRDLVRIKAELIAEHFTMEQLQAITGEEVTPEIMQTLQNDKVRGYTIDIETESTVMEDSEQDKRDRMEFLNAIMPVLPQAIQAASMSPDAGLLYLDLIQFGMKGFKVSRPLEEAFDEQRFMLEQAKQQPKGPPKPDPKMMEVQGKLQIEQAKLQQKAQSDAQKAQLEQQKAQFEARLKIQELQSEYQMKEQMAQLEARLRGSEISLEQRNELARLRMELQARREELQTEAQLERENMRLEASIKDRDSQRKTSAMKDRGLGGGL